MTPGIRGRAATLGRLAAALLGAGLLGACGPTAGGGGDGGTPGNACTQATAAPGLAITASGAVQGHPEAHTWAWLGIPYAAPPVGALRFQAPQPPGCLDGTLDAKAFSPACPQIGDNGQFTGSEDCLYLNVWAPQTGNTTGLPVMVFVHGGSNLTGSTAATLLGVPLYEGQNLARAAHAVVVTLNYRLGPLGFLALPELAAADPEGSTGNLGLLDQLAALRWVHENIAAFGGDPKHVLLFGESAGAIDTCALYASPKAKGLFSAALMESGLCDGEFFRTLADRESISETEAARVGCTDAKSRLACLRGLTAKAIITGMQNGSGYVPANWDPTVDGAVLPKVPLDAIAAGRGAGVPLILGTNTEETGLWVGSVATAADYAAQVHQLYGQTVGDEVLTRYPVADYPSPKAALVQVTTDQIFACPTRRAARAAAEAGVTVRRYLFAHGTAGFPPIHGLELFFVFDDLESAGANPTPGELSILEAMQLGWGHFAATGDPNGAGVPTWPVYDPTTDDALRLDVPISVTQGIETTQCDFWDGVP